VLLSRRTSFRSVRGAEPSPLARHPMLQPSSDSNERQKKQIRMWALQRGPDHGARLGTQHQVRFWWVRNAASASVNCIVQFSTVPRRRGR